MRVRLEEAFFETGPSHGRLLAPPLPRVATAMGAPAPACIAASSTAAAAAATSAATSAAASPRPTRRLPAFVPVPLPSVPPAVPLPLSLPVSVLVSLAPRRPLCRRPAARLHPLLPLLLLLLPLLLLLLVLLLAVPLPLLGALRVGRLPQGELEGTTTRRLDTARHLIEGSPSSSSSSSDIYLCL